MQGVVEGMGLHALASDLHLEAALSVFADSSTAIGICKRSGTGSVCHLAVCQRWVQERLKAGVFRAA